MPQSIIQSTGANGFGVKITADGFSETEEAKLSLAAAHFAEAVGSQQFKDFMLNFYYLEAITTGKVFRKKTTYSRRSVFRYNDGLNNEQIYLKLMAGSETLQKGEDKEADIDLKIDRRNKRGVLGYTYANTTTQWIYNWFFRDGTAEDVAGNISHEWCHKMGFGHEYSYTALRNKSVPYAVGYFVRDYKKDLTWQQIHSKIYS